MKSYANQSFNRGDDRAKLKPQHGDPYVDNQGRERGAFRKQPFRDHQQSPLRTYRVDDNFTPLKLPIQDVFEAIKGQPWVKHQEAKSHDPTRPKAKDYFSFHDCKAH